MEKFEYMPSLGRFTLRDEGKYFFFNFRTIGFGEVTKFKPAKALMKEQREQLGVAEKSETKEITEKM